MIQIVLPHKHLSFRHIGGQADITRDAIACSEDITSVLTLEDHLSLTFVDHLETRLLTMI